MLRISTFIAVLLVATVSTVFAGGWDAKKGIDGVKLDGQLVCIGCSLKKMSGANAQCNLYAHHAIGFKAGDGTLWSIVDNEKGHDITRAHKLLEGKRASITGWIYPAAHFVEVAAISVDGVTDEEIAQAGWEEDMLLAKRLAERKVGQVPAMEHSH